MTYAVLLPMRGKRARGTVLSDRPVDPATAGIRGGSTQGNIRTRSAQSGE